MGTQKSQLGLILLILAPLTCLSASLPSEYSIVGNDHDFLSEERVIEIFQQWKEKHQKVYKHAEEAEKRLENFRRNLKYIIEKNANRKLDLGHKVGLNKFADMSNEEFKQRFLSKVKKPIKKRSIQETMKQRNLGSCDAPSSLDWRKKGVVTAVKNQGDCGTFPSFKLCRVFFNRIKNCRTRHHLLHQMPIGFLY